MDFFAWYHKWLELKFSCSKFQTKEKMFLRTVNYHIFSSTSEGGRLKGRGAYLIKQNESPVAKISWYETE